MQKIIVGGFALLASRVLACDCVGSSIADQYVHSDVVFVGTVINEFKFCGLETRKPPERSGFNSEWLCVGEPAVWLVEPMEAFKNPWHRLEAGSKFRAVYILQDGSDCSAYLEIGKPYLFFGQVASGDTYSTSSCQGTTEAVRAEEALKKLRKLKKAFEDASQP